MRQNNTVFYKIAGIFWTIQTILGLVNVFTGEVEGLGMLIGIGLMICEGICAYALFTGDTYKFYTCIKILSIAVTVAVVIIALASIRILSIIPGVYLGMMLVLGLLVADYWFLTDVSKKADDNISVEKNWYIPGVIYLVTILVSYAFVESVASKYGLNMDVGSVLISDNLVMLIFGTALFFFTGYGFYEAQKSAVNGGAAYASEQNMQNNVSNGAMNVFGNIYNNNQRQNQYYNPNVNNTNNNFNGSGDDVNNEQKTQEINQGEKSSSGESKFTLKKD